MDLWQAIVLGIVQGLTEFLPVSSSGHLLLLLELMDVSATERQLLAFTVAMHTGTLLALVVYFRRDLAVLLRALARSVADRRVETPEQRQAWFILFGTAPAVLAYLLFKEQIHALERNEVVIASMLIGVSFVFLLAERFRGERTIEQLRLRDALIIGCGQAIALIPGTSRSGATISTGMLLGFDRTSAARFSFLLATPVVFGASVLELPNILDAGSDFILATAAGFVAAALSGYVAVAALLRFLANHSLGWFAAYRIPVGILFLLYFTTR